MSWTARITKAPDGDLRLQFSEPLRHIDMDRATARHLAALLVVASEGKRSEPLEGPKRSPPGTPQPKTSQTHSVARLL